MYLNPSQSDEDLLLQVSQGHPHALDELYRRYSKRMLVYFLRMLGNDEPKAQDFLQDLFIRVIEKGHQFREGAHFSTWLFSIAHNMCKNEYRAKEVRRIMKAVPDADIFAREDGEEEILTVDLDNRQFTAAVHHCLNDIDSAQKSAFLLRYQENLSIREISEIMACADGTTKSRLFYVTRKLASRLRAFNPNNDEVNPNEAD